MQKKSDQLQILLDACWNWPGDKGNRGYGRVKRRGKHLNVHRIAYEAFVGPIPDGLLVLHHCDNPACCNPDHLYVGTQQMNVQDRVRRNRNAIGSRVRTAVLNEAKVMEIRRLAAEGTTPKVLARQFGVARNTISLILNRRTWRHI